MHTAPREGARRTDRVPRGASPGGCAARPPVRGAGSPRRAGAAGRWGPGRPYWASVPHPGRGGGDPAPLGLRLARPPPLDSEPRPSCTHRSLAGSAAVAAGAGARAAGKAGRGPEWAGIRGNRAGRRAARPLASRSHGNYCQVAALAVGAGRCPAAGATTRTG